jgi:hypothetical protein
LAAAVRQQAAADKAAEAKALAEALVAITEIHRQEFPPAARPIAPEAPRVDTAEIIRRHRKSAKQATSLFAWRTRKSALAQSAVDAQEEIAAGEAERLRLRAAHQAELDAWWSSLERCDADTVLGTLADAFEDNDAAAAAVGVDGTEVSLLVVVPPASAVPDRKPTTTQAGNLSLKKLTKTESADFYKMLVCGHLLVTLREAFAVVPGLSSARVVAVRASEPDAYGKRRPEVLMAGRCGRRALDGVRWSEANSARIFNDCLTERLAAQKGAAGALQPVPIEGEPELKALLAALDIEEMLE